MAVDAAVGFESDFGNSDVGLPVWTADGVAVPVEAFVAAGFGLSALEPVPVGFFTGFGSRSIVVGFGVSCVAAPVVF